MKKRMLKGLNLCFVLLNLFIRTHAQNYDESNIPVYSLPDVLKTVGGTVVNDKTSWEKIRRPQVVKLFEDHVYGHMPKTYDSMTFAIMHEDAAALNGRAHGKEVAITVWRLKKPVTIRLVLFIPNTIKKPMPVFLFINNRDRDNTDPARSIKREFWPAELVIDSGYAIAAFHVSDAAPDDTAAYQKGVLQLYPEVLHDSNGTKAVGAWAWAASRVLDYFQKETTVDAGKAAIVGHSRGGKAALWAGAQDQRFALTFSNCSGNTGAALSRRKFGETVARINTQFPHWFADRYKQYNENEGALPVDQHMLIALLAPRPVYVTSASEDLWADPKGSYLSLVHARPVYALYGKQADLPSEPPAINTPIIHSVLGYHNREGVHDLTVFDWRQFIRFANFHFKQDRGKSSHPEE
jgi:hypothetical protein